MVVIKDCWCSKCQSWFRGVDGSTVCSVCAEAAFQEQLRQFRLGKTPEQRLEQLERMVLKLFNTTTANGLPHF